jgi:GNAT superfamily N-acetyltransferase
MTVNETLRCGRTVRLARADDLGAIVRLMADDTFGAGREQLAEPLPPSYADAFAAIDADPRNELIVVAEPDGQVVATLQVTFIPGLSRGGSERALVEAVRVASALRGQGLGRRLMEWAVQRARRRGCRLVQLTSDKARTDAHRFYESLGFVRSHDGFKLWL